MPRREVPVNPDAGPLGSFAAELRDLRDKAGRDAPGVDKISGRTGVPRSTLYAVLKGARVPSEKALSALVRSWGGEEAEWLAKRTKLQEDLTLQKDELYKSGPWLIVYGQGSMSKDWAWEIAEHCSERGVDYNLAAANEAVASAAVEYFTALVIALPTIGNRASPSSHRVTDLIRAYRVRRPEGLDSLIEGRRRWFEVGVVQVFDSAGGARPAFTPVMDMISRYHQLGQDETPMPFACYGELGQPGQGGRYWHPTLGDLRRWYPTFEVYAASSSQRNNFFDGPHVAAPADLDRVAKTLRVLEEECGEALKQNPLPSLEQLRSELVLRRQDDSGGREIDSGSPCHNFWHWLHGDS